MVRKKNFKTNKQLIGTYNIKPLNKPSTFQCYIDYAFSLVMYAYIRYLNY